MAFFSIYVYNTFIFVVRVVYKRAQKIAKPNNIDTDFLVFFGQKWLGGYQT